MEYVKICLDIEYNSNAARQFKDNIFSGIEMNNLFMTTGLNDFCINNKTFPSWITKNLFYRAMTNLAVSFLEGYFIDLLIEKLEDVETKDDLIEKIVRETNIEKKFISFQSLRNVDKYFKRYFGVSIMEYDRIDDIEEIMSYRHVDTHNSGKFDKKFKSNNPQIDQSAVGAIKWEGSFAKHMTDLQVFIRYIDNAVKNNGY